MNIEKSMYCPSSYNEILNIDMGNEIKLCKRKIDFERDIDNAHTIVALDFLWFSFNAFYLHGHNCTEWNYTKYL